MKPMRPLIVVVFALVLGSSYFAYGALGGATGVRIPYNGTLERDGLLISGNVDITFAVFNAASGGSACYTSSPITTTVTSGRFSVVVGPVTESCVKNKDIWFGVTVNEGAGDVPLPGRQQVYPAVAAMTAGTGDFDVPGSMGVGGGLTVGTTMGVTSSLTVGGSLSAGSTTVGALTVGGGMDIGLSYGVWDGCYFLNCPSGTQLFAPDAIGPTVGCASGVNSLSHSATGWFASCAPSSGCPTSFKGICTRIQSP